MTAKAASAMDHLIGSRIRQRRMLLGMTQNALAEALGISIPQVRKYENGTDRVGASRLYKIAGILRVPVTHFFEPCDNGTAAGAREHDRPDPSLFADDETVELAMAFNRIQQPGMRRAVIDLVRAAAILEAGTLKQAEPEA